MLVEGFGELGGTITYASKNSIIERRDGDCKDTFVKKSEFAFDINL